MGRASLKEMFKEIKWFILSLAPWMRVLLPRKMKI